ncbi:mitogen-activated protein kinase kinase kinase 5-like [Hibiscus syriacus]|nr:mitogen-activated protein kinase kinase kinase 5-like [Hibiscus syriacus]
MGSDLKVVKGMSFRTGQLTEWVKWKRLGSGGFRDVYLATLTKPYLRSVAVKFCESPSPSLQKEYRVLRHFLHSPNIVQCYGESITVEDGVTNHNLLLEYAADGNLLKFDQDVRWENSRIWCEIADFGLAKQPGEREEYAIVSPYLQGTLMYMSPETFYEGKIGAAMDIWSLGCTIVEMKTGKPPSMETMEITDIIPQRMSKSGKDFLTRCFAMDPNQQRTAKSL